VVCTCIGSALTAASTAGVVVSCVKLSKDQDTGGAGPLYATSIVGLVAGVICLTPGVVFLCLGDNKLRNIAIKHNVGIKTATLSLEPTSYGMGVCLKF